MSDAQKNKGGRPSSMTPEIRAKLLEALRGGNYRGVACQWAGVDDSTLRRWMRKGLDEPDSEWAKFREEVIEAEQSAEVRAVALIMRGAESDPKHAQWWLERKFPERWGRKDRLALTGRDGGAIQAQVSTVDMTKLSDDELATLEAIATRLAEPGEPEA